LPARLRHALPSPADSRINLTRQVWLQVFRRVNNGCVPGVPWIAFVADFVLESLSDEVSKWKRLSGGVAEVIGPE